jgi:hypothetical protein
MMGCREFIRIFCLDEDRATESEGAREAGGSFLREGATFKPLRPNQGSTDLLHEMTTV